MKNKRKLDKKKGAVIHVLNSKNRLINSQDLDVSLNS